MKLFFALWPPRETARALGEWARAVQRETGGRATAEETIHLTLAFLGEADAQKASAAARAVRFPGFELEIGKASYWKHNRILWAGPAATPPGLADLVSHLHPALKRAGFVLEERPFAAHVTLVRKASPPDSLPPLPAVTWPVAEFTLVRSVPAGSAVRYETLARFPCDPGK